MYCVMEYLHASTSPKTLSVSLEVQCSSLGLEVLIARSRCVIGLNKNPPGEQEKDWPQLIASMR